MKRVKTKSQTVLGATSYVCISYRGKTSAIFFVPPPHPIGLRIHWRLSTILKRSNESVWSNFCYVKVQIFWKFIQYTIHWDKTQMLKKCPSDKITATKNTLFFLSRAPITVLLSIRYSYMSCSAISILPCFYYSLYFCLTKSKDSLTLKRHNSFQN